MVVIIYVSKFRLNFLILYCLIGYKVKEGYFQYKHYHKYSPRNLDETYESKSSHINQHIQLTACNINVKTSTWLSIKDLRQYPLSFVFKWIITSAWCQYAINSFWVCWNGQSFWWELHKKRFAVWSCHLIRLMWRKLSTMDTKAVLDKSFWYVYKMNLYDEGCISWKSIIYNRDSYIVKTCFDK